MTARTLAVVSAGLSTPSSTRLLADRLSAASVAALRSAGDDPTVQVVELRDHARNLADNLVTGFADGTLQPVIDSVTSADGLIVVTPVFSGSYSGLFKTFFDVLPRDALAGKPVLAAATGGTARHSLALDYAVRPLLTHLRAATVPTAVFAAPEDWAGAEALRPRVERAAAELAGLVAGTRHAPDGSPDGSPVDPPLDGPFGGTPPFAQLLGQG
ncbi:FMN reductase [Jatrophihabitans endophyticus]|uniref:FMN reductase n=1 Tax=Jatrophihabitans endophyticus TaxID=1206085 RepID=A0A1M5M129_9ACTN|nr:FMN reductase [Jatrophihabitans endophyticus]SHG71064.1 FMN reductase [Jatrophihabitans endophyticus]